MMMLRKWILMMLVAALLVGACGDDDETGSQTSSTGAAGGFDDGLFHPEPNGVTITETAACELLEDAVRKRALALPNCIKTTPSCPNFLRVQYDPDCVLYDDGTVQACKKFYDAVSSCAELVKESCVLVVYPGTEPQGCE